jgi:hypothetical protein
VALLMALMVGTRAGQWTKSGRHTAFVTDASPALNASELLASEADELHPHC